MIINDNILKYGERAVFSLRELYSKFGYAPYKMSKFEEYDLYVRNKDFLISDGVITFTDTNGRLMALKPDVTLSIIKNSKEIPGFVKKLYYDENVYRVSEKSQSFKEVMQVGLECIGDIDVYCLCEVLSLAVKSLKCIDKDAVLDVSHLGIISSVFDAAKVPESIRSRLLALMGEKSIHELRCTCEESEISKENTELILKLCRTYGSIVEVMPVLSDIFESVTDKAPLCELREIVMSLSEEERELINIDFSVVSDIKYYNGIVFKGFIKGVAGSVLSGGQYDRLMRSMNKNSSAVGFAVYLDMLDRLEGSSERYDADAVLLYCDNESIEAINSAKSILCAEYERVSIQRSLPAGYTYKKLFKLTEGEVKEVENNA